LHSAGVSGKKYITITHSYELGSHCISEIPEKQKFRRPHRGSHKNSPAYCLELIPLLKLEVMSYQKDNGRNSSNHIKLWDPQVRDVDGSGGFKKGGWGWGCAG
jgi:hypothetical protein